MSGQNRIFRKASLERVSSPEQLNDYIKVFHPSLWLILAAVLVLLLGGCIWGVFGRLTTLRETTAVVMDGRAICFLSPKDMNLLTPGMEVQMENKTGSVTAVAAAPIEIPPDFDSYALYLGGFQVGDWVLPVSVEIGIPDGVYTAKIVLESLSPISFVWN